MLKSFKIEVFCAKGAYMYIAFQVLLCPLCTKSFKHGSMRYLGDTVHNKEMLLVSVGQK